MYKTIIYQEIWDKIEQILSKTTVLKMGLGALVIQMYM